MSWRALDRTQAAASSSQRRCATQRVVSDHEEPGVASGRGVSRCRRRHRWQSTTSRNTGRRSYSYGAVVVHVALGGLFPESIGELAEVHEQGVLGEGQWRPEAGRPQGGRPGAAFVDGSLDYSVSGFVSTSRQLSRHSASPSTIVNGLSAGAYTVISRPREEYFAPTASTTPASDRFAR